MSLLPEKTAILPPSPPHSSQAEDIAPPISHESGTYSDNPLLERFLQDLKAKTIAPHIFEILPEAYSASERSLSELDPEVWGYVSDKLRHDLVDDTLLILRMPSTVHEIVGQKVVKSIQDQLESIRQISNKPTQSLIDSIDSLRSSRIQWSARHFREPDEQFKVKGFRFPGIVIDIARTKSSKSISRKADELIVESYGDVQIVIALDIEVTGRVRVSAWRPRITQEDGENMLSSEAHIHQAIVRNIDGTCPAPTNFVRLQLGDFGPASLAMEYPGAILTHEIRITYAELSRYVREGEIEKRVQDQPPVQRSNLKKRRRSASAGEEVVSGDERLFKRRETEAQERTEAEDGDYQE